MSRTGTILLSVLVIALMSACAAAPTPASVPQPTMAPSATPTPTDTPVPTITPTAAPTSVPTAGAVAPEATFMLVGSVAEFAGEHGVSGKAIVAGLQTMIIQRFNFDGKGPQIDVLLTMNGEAKGAVATLITLEQRIYENEAVVMRIPAEAEPGSANSITIYCPETDTVYATAKFK